MSTWVAAGRRLVPALLALILTAAALALAGSTQPASAQSAPSSSAVPSTIDRGVVGAGALGDIIPEPGSGRAPQQDGDRGSRSQLIAFAALAGGLALLAALASRDIRRAQASRRGRQDAATSTLSEPVADSSVNPPSSSARQ
jgi:hypothetical protein